MPQTAHIYIYGDIVSQQVPSLGQSGAVSLTSVKDAYNSNSTCNNIVVHIHSNGGSVFEGFAIHDFLVNTGKPITTIVEGLCCSIATVIFMAGTERKLTENSRFLIHNPWGNGEGDAAYFRQYANELQNEQSRLLTFYKQRTGASNQLLQSYMTAEKLMSPELAVELKFATGIIDTVKAMALYSNQLHNPYKYPSTNNAPQQHPATPQKQQHMDKTKKNRFSQLISGLKNLVKDFNNDANIQAAAKTLVGDDGDLYFDGDLAEGTAVFTDDALTIPAADGDYEFEDGTTITIADGLVTDVAQPTGGTATSADPEGRAVLASLRKKLAILKAEKLELENTLAQSETVMASASKALQMAKSSYRPEKRENKFNRSTKPAGNNLAEKMDARRAELKAKKGDHKTA
ncbi:ATP-dependent protease ClpP protease subunit [Mucilaginibacter gracilis]|uniref:ATP-dependent Clp protease proteolytic subunit n=1 Tax=Mucilaginibacter gracilis TaxID=423350 RepID=A0A495J7C7_9SPHI|nr:head maturation protease, ClpP-related [Mucilaginibacter gracilis]RKR84906.1 ATP-dependent protease ClpP protease subunit [Mucilaginibacter gracilis]